MSEDNGRTEQDEMPEVGHFQLQLNVSINQREFAESPVRYATLAHVSYDGVNFHLVFLATTPPPLVGVEPSENVDAQVVARIVLPPTSALTTALLLRDEIEKHPPQAIVPMPGQSLTSAHDDE